MASVKYFAYGSNMAPDVMASYAPNSRLLGAASLAGYRLAFTRRSVRTSTGVADIVPASGATVWGALYDMTETEFGALDRKEGAGWAYALTPVRVELAATGEAHDAVAYTVVAHDAEYVPPSAAYLDGLIAGARGLGLSGAYIASLEALRDG